MNVLVCSKLSFPHLNRTLPDWDSARSLGHTIWVRDSYLELPNRPDVIIGMGVSVLDETFKYVKNYPEAKLFCYNWDCYEWVWNNPRPGEYDYVRYGKLLNRATEIWVPSVCTGMRTTQWWNLTNWNVVLSSCPYWNVLHSIKSDGYALCALREIPDPQWNWFELACKELKIPYVMTGHEETYSDYKEYVANCKFIVSHLHELSTGGLTLLEGYYHGKPCLLSDSKWHGGKDYFGSNATYFKDGSYSDFKGKLWTMYTEELPSKFEQLSRREWVIENFSDSRMVADMLKRIWKTVQV